MPNGGLARRLAVAALTIAALIAATAAPASAEHNRPVPPELDQEVETAHFVVHYTTATASTQYAQAGAADFEEAYSRLVTGGGGTPNAGLRAGVPTRSRAGLPPGARE